MDRLKLGVILTILPMVIVSSACGPSAEPTPPPSPPAPTPTPAPPPTPPGNRPPVISSLTPTQTEVYLSPQGGAHPVRVEIQCVASDPDGDTISYEWSTTGGKFTGTGPTVSWVAPANYGDYTITVSTKDGKGGIREATVTMSVVQNMDPVISSLVADPVTVLPQGRSTISCVATDPDGGALIYRWEASDGSITGSGNTATWTAPDREGGFSITVFVDDDKGGGTLRTVLITAQKGMATETFNSVLNETGTVSSTGRNYTVTEAGDDADNIGYRAFWCFDLYSLTGTEVKEAMLAFTTKQVVGDPFARGPEGLRGLRLWQIRDDTVGALPSYYADWEKQLGDIDIMWEAPEVIDVTEEVSRIGRGLSPRRLQLRADFLSKTNGNCFAQYIEWDSVTLTVTYTKK